MPDRNPLSAADVSAALATLPDWRARVGALHAAYAADSVAAALEFVARIGQLAEELDHHPDVDWRYRHVFIRSTSHSAGGTVTGLDVELATRISAEASGLELTAEPARSRTVEIAIDTANPDAISALWADALGYRCAGGHEAGLVDPWGRGPTVWFQRTATPNASRLHVDVCVADELAQGQAEALAAPGVTVDDAHAPAFWVVTDVQGNRVCVCTNAPDPEDEPAPTAQTDPAAQ